MQHEKMSLSHMTKSLSHMTKKCVLLCLLQVQAWPSVAFSVFVTFSSSVYIITVLYRTTMIMLTNQMTNSASDCKNTTSLAVAKLTFT